MMPTFPGLPVSASWPDHEEELAALREFRADYDRLMSTEGQSHGEAIAALSGLVASARQRTSAQPVDLDPIRLRLSEVRGARAGRWDFHRAVGSTLAFNANAARDVEVLLAEVDRLTAALTACEARCDALSDRVTAAEGRLELSRGDILASMEALAKAGKSVEVAYDPESALAGGPGWWLCIDDGSGRYGTLDALAEYAREEVSRG